MSFDVTMPDGTVIQDVPDGMTKAQIQAKYTAHTAASAPSAQGIGGQIKSYLGGIENGLYALPQGAIKMGARATDAVGLTHGGYDTVNREFQDAAKMTGGGGNDRFSKGGKILGETIGTAPLMAAGPLAGGAMTGAALSDAPDAKGLALDTAMGGAGGYLGDKAVRGVASVVAPKVSPMVEKLLGENVRLTPGQILGGTTQRFEDKLSSVPFVGDMIANARIRGLQDFNRAAIDRSVAPIGAKVPDNLGGREAVDYAHTELSKKYNQILSQATFDADPQFKQGVVSLTALAQNIPQYGAKPLQDFITTNIAPRLSQAGKMSGKEFKEVDELLGTEIKDYQAGGPNDRKLARAFMQLQAELKDGLSRSNPALRTELDNTDAGFANLVRIENAAARSGGAKGAEVGTFSPAQLSAAVKATDKSARKNAVARGNALMQDLSDAGNSVLPQQVPDSGTPGRIAAMLLAGGGLGHMISPGAAAPVAALMGAYTKPGIKGLEYALARRPAGAQNLAMALRKYAPIAAAPSAVGASGLAAQLMGQQ